MVNINEGDIMSELNRDNLAEEFDIENEEIEIETFKEILDKAKELEDPNNVLSSAIEKAGRFLDMIERESVNGNFSARMMEVAANLINVITTTANSIATINSTWFNDELKQVRSQQKWKELDQKDKELELKKMYYQNQLGDGNPNGTTNNNVIVTDRESVLKFLKNEQKEIGENNETE